MSYEAKRFCFTCKQTSEQLEALGKTLKSCAICKTAQYCGTACQSQDFLLAHKEMCMKTFKPLRKEAIKIEENLKALGVDINESKFDTEKLSPKAQDLIMFQYLQTKDLSTRLIGEIARRYESYHGFKSCLENTLRNMMSLQPTFFFPRNYVPLMMVQLGRDDDAYNFIKFWLKNTRIEEVEGDDGFFFHTSEDDVFGDDLLPFNEISMKDQDKNEDIMEALSIDVNKKPYFPYLGFYITLAIIKKNNFEASKDVTQKNHFIKYLEYIKRHYKSLPKQALLSVSAYQPGRYKVKIPASFKLERKKWIGEDTQDFGEQFLSNWFDDLKFYLKRAPGLREEMLQYL